MARRGVPPRKANHMRRRTRSSEVKKEIIIQEYVQNYTNVFPNTSVVLF